MKGDCMSILITGAAGYIGSHTCVELLSRGEDIIALDNYVNSCSESLKRVEEITGRSFKIEECDIRDAENLERIFTENDIDIVIHFAGLKAVGESCVIPLDYYDNNVSGTVTMLEIMKKHNVKRIIFSSSATVYGDNKAPMTEDMPTGKVTNPYGRTKFFIEEMLKDLYASDNDWSMALLRYFNPIGAHESGLIGEDPNGIPNNLMPRITRIASGKPLDGGQTELTVYGDDYDTPDGTCIRDYIHVVDLAIGHVKAINYVRNHRGVNAINLGTGKGYSVFELINTFEEATGVKVPYRILPRRAGDLAEVYSSPEKAKKVLGFETERDLKKMCEDVWRWVKNNPNGYK